MGRELDTNLRGIIGDRVTKLRADNAKVFKHGTSFYSANAIIYEAHHLEASFRRVRTSENSHTRREDISVRCWRVFFLTRGRPMYGNEKGNQVGRLSMPGAEAPNGMFTADFFIQMLLPARTIMWLRQKLPLRPSRGRRTKQPQENQSPRSLGIR